MGFGRFGMENEIHCTGKVTIASHDNYFVSHRLYRMSIAVSLRGIAF